MEKHVFVKQNMICSLVKNETFLSLLFRQCFFFFSVSLLLCSSARDCTAHWWVECIDWQAELLQTTAPNWLNAVNSYDSNVNRQRMLRKPGGRTKRFTPCCRWFVQQCCVRLTTTTTSKIVQHSDHFIGIHILMSSLFNTVRVYRNEKMHT